VRTLSERLASRLELDGNGKLGGHGCCPFRRCPTRHRALWDSACCPDYLLSGRAERSIGRGRGSFEQERPTLSSTRPDTFGDRPLWVCGAAPADLATLRARLNDLGTGCFDALPSEEMSADRPATASQHRERAPHASDQEANPRLPGDGQDLQELDPGHDGSGHGCPEPGPRMRPRVSVVVQRPGGAGGSAGLRER
jgi:hypothetical protein